MAATLEKLRHAIDSGKSRDKVRAFDPAMAPLGTDEEAAGTPLRPHEVETARQQEIVSPREHADESHATWLAVVGVAAVFAIAVLSAAVWH
jgi:hypothetical protein